MAAYVVFIRDRTKNASEMAAYGPKAEASLAGHAVKVLAAYGRHEVLEGPAVEGVVIVEFPTFGEAKAWYDSLLIARRASTVSRVPITALSKV